MKDKGIVLLIVAAGKSSRFGGYPKAFCNIGNTTNVENTIKMASSHFDKVYIGVNKNTYNQFNSKIKGCEMFGIVTGQGDAHSLLKCLNYIKKNNSNIGHVVVCWGDAIFISDKPFKQLLENEHTLVNVACAIDSRPYAWFDINDSNEIVKSHFAKDEGFIDEGIHDQSLFLFDIDYAIDYLSEYRESLGIPYDNDESKSDINEMKLLKSFEYLNDVKHNPARCVLIDKDNVLSFNTKEELKDILDRNNSK